jgi:hypothetical protein
VTLGWEVLRWISRYLPSPGDPTKAEADAPETA